MQRLVFCVLSLSVTGRLDLQERCKGSDWVVVVKVGCVLRIVDAGVGCMGVHCPQVVSGKTKSRLE